VAESQVSLAELSLEEDHPEQAETLLRPAIAEFEKENGTPDATSAYTLLSRALLTEGKLEEARKAIQHAAELGRKTPDPALTLPLAIQNARIEMAATAPGAAGRVALTAARQQLLAVIASARQRGYYQIECEARLALGEAQLKANLSSDRSQLETLEKETHERGLELLSRKAQSLVSADQSSPSHITLGCGSMQRTKTKHRGLSHRNGPTKFWRGFASVLIRLASPTGFEPVLPP
jgi:ATP/maltotriose-dependent transcriptional regulator MalT